MWGEYLKVFTIIILVNCPFSFLSSLSSVRDYQEGYEFKPRFHISIHFFAQDFVLFSQTECKRQEVSGLKLDQVAKISYIFLAILAQIPHVISNE